MLCMQYIAGHSALCRQRMAFGSCADSNCVLRLQTNGCWVCLSGGAPPPPPPPPRAFSHYLDLHFLQGIFYISQIVSSQSLCRLWGPHCVVQSAF
jgi:hypothetical protein